jgi:hypothetical protein
MISNGNVVEPVTAEEETDKAAGIAAGALASDHDVPEVGAKLQRHQRNARRLSIQ